MGAIDGLFVKTMPPAATDTMDTLAYYSGSKSGYGINVQAIVTANHRVSAVSAVAPGAANDWVAYDRSALCHAVNALPAGFHVLGDAAYPLSQKLLTPYPGEDLPDDAKSFNFHLDQLRVKAEQAFGIFVSTWGILWKPLRIKFFGRADLIKALFHVHNFLRDEGVEPIDVSEESKKVREVRPQLRSCGRLPSDFQTKQVFDRPRGLDETPTRRALTMAVDEHRQFCPQRKEEEGAGAGAGASG